MVHPERPPAAMARFGLAVVLGLAGCSMVPKSRVDDCAKVAQALRAENAQLKDSTLSLKGENADLTQRALDDGRKIAALEDANSRFESSVQAYIDEREGLNESFQKFRRIAQAGAKSPSTAFISRLRSFVADHEGTTFDPAASTLAIEADRLFLPCTDRLRPGGSRLLDDLGGLLSEPEAKRMPLVVAGHAGDSAVRTVSTASPEPSPGDLSLARAVRIRDALAERTRRDPSRLGVAGLGTSRPLVTGQDDRARSKNARIEIELSPTFNGADAEGP
jgi:chemotaxis protein MotB